MKKVEPSSNPPWYIDWFDSPYYHLLYDHRDQDEAEFFMKNLLDYLQLASNAKILDIPCGKGRHALFLNQLGYNVIGADLSENSIDHAKAFENEKLRFEVHDMRRPFSSKFNAIFNLFTSFGYFDSQQEHSAVLQHLKNGLLPGGIIVIDFMNVKYIEKNLIDNEKVIKSGVEFNLKRSVTTEHICKEIFFRAGEKDYHFTEKVAFLTLEKFKILAQTVGLNIHTCFGGYDLSPYHEETSERLILLLS